MNSAQLVFSLLVGALIGALYFGGLWYTVRQLPTARRPALLFIGSYLLRLALLLGAVYLLAGSHWYNMLSALVGILLARTLLIRRWGPGAENDEQQARNRQSSIENRKSSYGNKS
ncbi:MAG: ATP synthase subunit I [Chloroflexi bacterium]|nr:ATP synthase subunit I [Chloroflexota bacterium]